MGLVIGLGYTFDIDNLFGSGRTLEDVSVRGEAYWNWVRNDLAFAISAHLDLFSLGDWVRGHGLQAEPAEL
jgi:hypothetical protein